ncbi:MAG TPA: MFS transporter [Limnobacter sp.]|uniref:MFS transporter n=1 Tax=Limnobacter sp. TaxID=2003368 RepID=UPI002EDA24E1
MFANVRRPEVLPIVLAAAGILMVTMGIRQSMGLFIGPINNSTGLGIATISFALAIGQFAWGAIQPIAGAVADRYGPKPVLQGGLVVLGLGCLLTAFVDSAWMLVLSAGLLAAIGSGAGSFSVLIGAAAQRLPADARGTASGIINAGGSLGQFVFAPLLQKLIQWLGWAGAIGSMLLVALATLPLVNKVTGQGVIADTQGKPGDGGLKQAVAQSLKDPSYLLLHAGFFTCGFHIAFLVTHLPGEVALCGLPANVASWSLAIIGLANIAGSLLVGQLISKHRSKMVLAVMYGSRSLLIVAYLLLPKTDWTFYAFAAGLGFTWLATVPPTASLVGKLFGTRYLGTLFGLTLLSHQIGGFLGAWLGGLAMVEFGNYQWMWMADIALAAMAAVANLPIREARVRSAVVA